MLLPACIATVRAAVRRSLDACFGAAELRPLSAATLSSAPPRHLLAPGCRGTASVERSSQQHDAHSGAGPAQGARGGRRRRRRRRGGACGCQRTHLQPRADHHRPFPVRRSAGGQGGTYHHPVCAVLAAAAARLPLGAVALPHAVRRAHIPGRALAVVMVCIALCRPCRGQGHSAGAVVHDTAATPAFPSRPCFHA